ncbi:MAG: LytTR family transcriptional regulator [Lachnospiraceae bacterium]|nr:LytTR family transcriptional regulator [Lachnospiraceae bacterium]
MDKEEYSNDEGKTENAFAVAKKEAGKENNNDVNSNMLLLKTKSRNIAVNKDNIMYVESHRRKKEIHMTDGVIEIYATMDELNYRLGNGFYQCHRGYIVNMAHVRKYSCDSIMVSSGELVYMSKEKYNGFKNSYTLYFKGI